MNFSIGDLVQTSMYDDRVIFEIICFLDRKGEQCAMHQGIEKNPALPDDAHLEVVWKSSKDVAPAWAKGEVVIVDSRRIQSPNEMMVIALAARGDLA